MTHRRELRLQMWETAPETGAIPHIPRRSSEAGVRNGD